MLVSSITIDPPLLWTLPRLPPNYCVKTKRAKKIFHRFEPNIGSLVFDETYLVYVFFFFFCFHRHCGHDSCRQFRFYGSYGFCYTDFLYTLTIDKVQDVCNEYGQWKPQDLNTFPVFYYSNGPGRGSLGLDQGKSVWWSPVNRVVEPLGS